MGNRKKRKKHSDSDMAANGDMKGSIDGLIKTMEDGFDSVRAEIGKLRQEFKHEMSEVKHEIQSVKQSITFTQYEVDTLKEKAETNMKETKGGLEELNKKIGALEVQLNAEIEKNIKLEQYTRRENLRFNNIREEEGEDCKSLIYNVIKKDMGIDTSETKFHAVHRVGKKIESRCRPIIARFISREDRNLIWQHKGKIKHSPNFPDAYITEDFAKAIQEERKVLIKAMLKARETEGLPNAKVVGRYLFIDNEKYDCRNIPEYLK